MSWCSFLIASPNASPGSYWQIYSVSPASSFSMDHVGSEIKEEESREMQTVFNWLLTKAKGVLYCIYIIIKWKTFCSCLQELLHSSCVTAENSWVYSITVNHVCEYHLINIFLNVIISFFPPLLEQIPSLSYPSPSAKKLTVIPTGDITLDQSRSALLLNSTNEPFVTAAYFWFFLFFYFMAGLKWYLPSFAHALEDNLQKPLWFWVFA